MAEPEQQAKQTPKSKPILRCERCGATYRRLQWTQGMKCPKCKSPDFFPLAIIDGAVDYTLADRSQGYAIEDIRFAQLAKWAGMITPNQYTYALARQRDQATQHKVVPHIAQVMINEGILQTTEATAVFKVMCKRRPAPDDEAFAAIALQNGLVTAVQLDVARQAQEQMAKVRHEVPPLGQLMYEKRYVNENQAQAIYQRMTLKREGVVYEINQAYDANRELTLAEKVMGTKDEPERRRSFILLCILGVIILGVWGHWLFGPSGEVMWFKCENPKCGKVFKGGYVDVFPTTCPYCKQKTALYARKCLSCGAIFGTNGWWGRATCPKCGKSRVEKYQGD